VCVRVCACVCVCVCACVCVCVPCTTAAHSTGQPTVSIGTSGFITAPGRYVGRAAQGGRAATALPAKSSEFSSSRHSPKSEILTWPRRSARMFAGLRSRCTYRVRLKPVIAPNSKSPQTLSRPKPARD
jgi:hypothetical protein